MLSSFFRQLSSVGELCTLSYCQRPSCDGFNSNSLLLLRFLLFARLELLVQGLERLLHFLLVADLGELLEDLVEVLLRLLCMI